MKRSAKNLEVTLFLLSAFFGAGSLAENGCLRSDTIELSRTSRATGTCTVGVPLGIGTAAVWDTKGNLIESYLTWFGCYSLPTKVTIVKLTQVTNICTGQLVDSHQDTQVLEYSASFCVSDPNTNNHSLPPVDPWTAKQLFAQEEKNCHEAEADHP